MRRIGFYFMAWLRSLRFKTVMINGEIERGTKYPLLPTSTNPNFTPTGGGSRTLENYNALKDIKSLHRSQAFFVSAKFISAKFS
jgi:hypothetical protein